MNISRVLITGANGFVGNEVALRLQTQENLVVRKIYRTFPTHINEQEDLHVGDIGPETKWDKVLDNVDAVIHCAARVHVMEDAGSTKSLSLFRKVNVEGTQRLARHAADAGVRRFVFVSSVKVNGETTTNLPPYTYLDKPAPEDAYGISKWEAEQALWKIAKETGLEVVVVRPPLVYGPGVKANFLRLMRAVQRGIPLPFGAVKNHRSMIYVKNLSDVLSKCLLHPDAGSKTFLVSDGSDLSTGELISHVAIAMNKKPLLLDIPPVAMRSMARLLGKSQTAERLLGSLQVDTKYTQDILNWQPPYTIEEGIKATVTRLLNS